MFSVCVGAVIKKGDNLSYSYSLVLDVLTQSKESLSGSSLTKSSQVTWVEEASQDSQPKGARSINLALTIFSFEHYAEA